MFPKNITFGQKRSSRCKKNPTKRRSTARRITRPLETLEARQLMAADATPMSLLDVTAGDHTAALIATVESGQQSDQSAQTAPSQTSQLSAAARQTVDAMKAIADQTGRIALDQIDQFASFAGIVIEAPTFGSDGSVTGTTTFGQSDAPVLFQYVGNALGSNALENDSLGHWVLAVKTDLGALAQSNDLIESPLEFKSPIVVFSAAAGEIESSAMSTQAQDFYGDLYASDDFTVRLQRGVNVLTTATIAEDSIPAELLDRVGLAIPEIQIEGVLFSEFSNDVVQRWQSEPKDTGFWEELREDVMLRATLPQIVINDLPPNLSVGNAFLVWQSPGTDQDQLYVSVDLAMAQSDGSIVELSGRVGIAETPTGNEFRLSATARNINNAFGVTGLDLDEVILLISMNTVKAPQPGQTGANQVGPTAVPSVSVGVLADMELGGRHVSIAGKVDFSMAAGTPVKIALRGELESLSSTDLMNFAKRLTGLGDVSSDPSKTPTFEIRDVVLNIAPLGGDVELGIEDGIGVRGELYIKGNLAGRVDGLIDRTGITPVVRLKAWTRAFDLGALSVTDVNIDILMSESSQDHFIVSGGVKMLGVSHDVDIHITPRRMYYNITTEVDGLGMVDYEFEASSIGVPFWTYRAVVRNDLSATLEGKVAGGLNDWIDQARKDFDKAQAGLDAAQREVDKLIGERDTAIKEAQRDFDEIKSNLAAAEKAVASLSSKVNSLRKTESARYSTWRKAVRSRKQAKWYNYAQRRAYEVATYARYASTKGLRLAAQGSLNVANATMSAVRASAGWILDAAGPEAHPEVIRINAELALKNAALDVAQLAVQAAEEVATGAVGALAFVAEHHDDLFMIDQVSFEGTLSAMLADNAVDFQIDYRFMNKSHSMGLHLAAPDLDLDDIAKQIVRDVKAGLA
ncbi:hypothetical protein Mal15_19990 [Stieleria maiorica]|uniref:Uncharacterized protein n=1 Tax=Stieleria maiorica TaxID=2795974 RepID=A0A5B9MB53_9BACT|nr:hypothetical protein [Stieleria maiorica]QEF97953.1 hypothetical protein Mal15_19990 [Stieleria maiorica]